MIVQHCRAGTPADARCRIACARGRLPASFVKKSGADARISALNRSMEVVVVEAGISDIRPSVQPREVDERTDVYSRGRARHGVRIATARIPKLELAPRPRRSTLCACCSSPPARRHSCSTEAEETSACSRCAVALGGDSDRRRQCRVADWCALGVATLAPMGVRDERQPPWACFGFLPQKGVCHVAEDETGSRAAPACHAFA